MPEPMFLWVTRSSPYNLLTGHRLRAMGHSVLTVPVLHVQPVDQAPLERHPDALVFTSAQAVRHHSFEARLASTSVFAVGDGTARAARRCGYTNVRSARGGVQDLQVLIATTIARPAHVVHYCAREPAGDLCGFLENSGFEAERRIVYESHEAGMDDLAGAVAALQLLDGIIVHSPRGAKRVAAVLRESRWHGLVFCISQACAREFGELAGLLVETAAEPDESALMSVVRRFRGRPAPRAPSPPGPLVTLSGASLMLTGRPPRIPHVANNDDGGPEDTPPAAA